MAGRATEHLNGNAIRNQGQWTGSVYLAISAHNLLRDRNRMYGTSERDPLDTLTDAGDLFVRHVMNGMGHRGYARKEGRGQRIPQHVIMRMNDVRPNLLENTE